MDNNVHELGFNIQKTLGLISFFQLCYSAMNLNFPVIGFLAARSSGNIIRNAACLVIGHQFKI